MIGHVGRSLPDAPSIPYPYPPRIFTPMSNQALNWAFQQDVQPTGAKFVLVTLANYATNDGTCWASQERIAADTSQGVRSVQRHLADLEAAGWIVSERRDAQGGRRLANGYRLPRFIESQHANLTGSTPKPTRQKRQPNPPITTCQPAKLAGTYKEELSQREPPLEPKENLLPTVVDSARPLTPQQARWEALEIEWGVAPEDTPKYGQFAAATKIYTKCKFTPEQIHEAHRLYREDEFFSTLNYSIMAVARRAQELLDKASRPPPAPQVKNPHLRSLQKMTKEQYDANIRGFSRRNGSTRSLPASTRNDGDGIDSPGRHVLPPTGGH